MAYGGATGAARRPAFLAVDGETPRLIADYDWSATLGAIADWPTSLQTTVGIMLRSPVPMVLLWGADGVMIYNDAYSEFAGGRHPTLLGSKVREGWPEVADFNDNVMRVGLAGETLSYRDHELTLHRAGRPEQVWMNLDYSPVLDESGDPAGVIAIVVETSDRVRTEAALRESERRLRFLDALNQAVAKLSDANEILATTTRLVGEHLDLSVCAYADMDDDEDGFTIRGDWAAPGSQSIVGHYSLADFGELAVSRLSAGEPLVINDNLVELAPHEAKTFQDIGVTATICMPLVKNGRLTALMAIHHKAARVWTEHELKLIREVTERSWAHVERVGAQAELNAGLREREAHLQLMVLELNHRVKNNLATVQAIAVQTLRGADDPAQAREAFQRRITALAAAHDILTREQWDGVGVAEIARGVLDALEDTGRRLQLSGPKVKLSSKAALALSMAFHELGTNALKYGAFSNAEGQVAVSWQVDPDAADRLTLVWREEGGPPVKTPKTRGFGSRLLERGLAAELDGEVQLEFAPEGLRCRITGLMAA